jgi:hypothetical protein
MHHHGYDTTGLVVFRRRCYASAVDCRMNGVVSSNCIVPNVDIDLKSRVMLFFR